MHFLNRRLGPASGVQNHNVGASARLTPFACSPFGVGRSFIFAHSGFSQPISPFSNKTWISVTGLARFPFALRILPWCVGFDRQAVGPTLAMLASREGVREQVFLFSGCMAGLCCVKAGSTERPLYFAAGTLNSVRPLVYCRCR